MDDKEIEAVLSLPAQLSYAYLVKRIVGRQRIWSLGTEEGWALSSDDEGRELVPVWPHERFAAACAEGSWRGYSPNPQLPYLLTRALTEGRSVQAMRAISCREFLHRFQANRNVRAHGVLPW
jgi:hypothetical protein